MLRFSTTLASSLFLSGAVTAQITMTEIAMVNLDATATGGSASFIGSNPAAIAWDGTDLYVAGYNNSVNAADIGIVRVTDALNAQTIGSTFGAINTPPGRGYTGLDVSAGTFAAAYDDGSTNPEGITHWQFPGLQLWSKTARGGSGVGFDPGFPGGNPANGSGVGWTTFGVGRRALQNGVTGGDIWTTTDGMIINTPQGTFWRDMDFDPDTGDVWLREGNNLIHVVRNGDNSTSGNTIVFDPDPDADFTNGQNVAYLHSDDGDYVIYNDRPNSALGQLFFDVVKLVDPSGGSPTVDWGGFTAPSSSGYYDFSWDEASSTLAILDFGNRDAYIFDVEVSTDIGTSYCTSTVNSTGMASTITATGSASIAANDLVLSADNLPAQPGIFIAGPTQAQIAFFNGFLCVDPNGLQRFLSVSTPAGGIVTEAVDYATSAQGGLNVVAGSSYNYQRWNRDPAAGGGNANFSDAIEISHLP